MIYEIRLETNVSPFSIVVVDNVNDIDRNFLPDWRFHLVCDFIPTFLGLEQFLEFIELPTTEYECISNPMVLVDLLAEYYDELD